MIIKKTFVTTSSFLITAVLLSQIYSFKNTIKESPSINFSAFSNLARNVNSITLEGSGAEVRNSIGSEDTAIMSDVIKVIDKISFKKCY